MMFEKARTFGALQGQDFESASAAKRAGERAGERIGSRTTRRAGEALRAVEWSELTARLNAARDLRLLIRAENQAPIELAAASFGDAAASYFALLDDDHPGPEPHDKRSVNRDALEQSKALGAHYESAEANRPGDAKGSHVDATCVDARDMP